MDAAQILSITDVFVTSPVIGGIAVIIGAIAIVVLAIAGGKWLLGSMKK